MAERFSLKLLVEIPAGAAEEVRLSVEEHLEAIGAVGISVELESTSRPVDRPAAR